MPSLLGIDTADWDMVLHIGLFQKMLDRNLDSPEGTVLIWWREPSMLYPVVKIMPQKMFWYTLCCTEHQASGSTLNSLKSQETCSILESCNEGLLNGLFILICKLFDNFFPLKFPRKSSCGRRNGPKACRWHFHEWYQQSPWWHGCQRVPKMAD